MLNPKWSASCVVLILEIGCENKDKQMKQCTEVRFDTLTPLPESLTFCATIDDAGHEQVVTDFMIRRACEQLDSDQVWPFAGGALCGGYRQLPDAGADIIPFG